MHIVIFLLFFFFTAKRVRNRRSLYILLYILIYWRDVRVHRFRAQWYSHNAIVIIIIIIYYIVNKNYSGRRFLYFSSVRGREGVYSPPRAVL